MAVVINEFEVVPAEPRATGSSQSEAESRDARPPKDPERELDRQLRRRATRAGRLRAV